MRFSGLAEQPRRAARRWPPPGSPLQPHEGYELLSSGFRRIITDFAQSRVSTATLLASRARAVAVDVALEAASSVALGLPATTVTLALTLGKSFLISHAQTIV